MMTILEVSEDFSIAHPIILSLVQSSNKTLIYSFSHRKSPDKVAGKATNGTEPTPDFLDSAQKELSSKIGVKSEGEKVKVIRSKRTEEMRAKRLTLGHLEPDCREMNT